jgi:hypothetical protein
MSVGATRRTSIRPRFIGDVTIDLASIDANDTADRTAAMVGLRPDMVLLCIEEDLDDGLAVVRVRCSADDTLELRIMNATGGGINPGSQVFTIVAI